MLKSKETREVESGSPGTGLPGKMVKLTLKRRREKNEQPTLFNQRGF
jgi:hypothetical protein